MPFSLPKLQPFADNAGGGRGGTGGCLPPLAMGMGREASSYLAELYPELRALARKLMGRKRCGSVQPTDLVNDLCEKVCARRRLEGDDTTEILSWAAAAMRNMLIDRGRARGRMKRTPTGQRVPVEEAIALMYEDRAIDVLALDEALNKLKGFDPLMARAVELRFYLGLPMQDVAEELGIALRTLERHWVVTKAWLRSEME